ncbi:MAG: hypothetical protein CMJ28_04820 [Phycisphaerae bacterium]|nr:hypothetical protein [Phycisphaerae bacterium]
MISRAFGRAFTLFEVLLALVLLVALSSLVVGVLLRSDRDHDLLQVQLNALVDISCARAEQRRETLSVWGQSSSVFVKTRSEQDDVSPVIYTRKLPGLLTWDVPVELAIIAPDGTVLSRESGQLVDGHLVQLGAVNGQVQILLPEQRP